MLLSLVTMAAKVKHYIFLLMLFEKNILCCFLSLIGRTSSHLMISMEFDASDVLSGGKTLMACKRIIRSLVREVCKKSKWKFKMAFAMKGGGRDRSRVPHTYFEK